MINTADQFNLLASNLVTTGSTEIAANNSLNISDGKETQNTSSYVDKITIDTGMKVGNAYVDAAYSVVDAVKAQKAVKDAYDKLEKIENLNDQGLASDKAVDRAQYQVVLALINAKQKSKNPNELKNFKELYFINTYIAYKYEETIMRNAFDSNSILHCI